MRRPKQDEFMVRLYFADAVAVSNKAHGYPDQPACEGPLKRLDDEIAEVGKRIQLKLETERVAALNDAPLAAPEPIEGEPI